MTNTAVVALVQGGYFCLTGIWPILSIGTFMRVTGPKSDLWLVKTVGAVLTVIGATLLIAAAGRVPGFSIAFLGIASALVLAAVDVVYAVKKTIAPVYLIDALVEVALAGAWVVCSVF